MNNKLLEELLKELLKEVKIKAGESAEEVLSIIKNNLLDVISLENIKEAWNLEEIKTEELSLAFISYISFIFEILINICLKYKFLALLSNYYLHFRKL